jgi:hypothetical protein
VEVKRTSFPNGTEERIRPILDAFLAEVRRITQDEYYPAKPYLETWKHGARKLTQVLKEEDTGEFMQWAFVEFSKIFKGDRPYDPGSLLFLVEKFKRGALHNWDSVLCSECFQSPCVCNTWDEDGILSAR